MSSGSEATSGDTGPGGRVLFFDVDVSGVRRFPAEISTRIRETAPEVETSAGYLIEDADPGKGMGALAGAEHVASGYRRWLERRRPDVLVLFSHRVPDLVLLGACRDLGIPTVMVQHGIYVEMSYGAGAFLSEKALRYLRLAPEVIRETDVPLGRLIRPWALQDGDLRADRALVYGEGYVEYFGENYGYPPGDCRVAGYPDYDGWRPGEPEPGACYIAQSLVEDGRVARPRFEEFVDVLARVADEMPLSVKLHPRSDTSLYEPLAERDVPMVRHGELPDREIYVSHSTTLLARAFRVTPKVLLWSFPTVAVPDFFRRWAAADCDDDDELVERARRLHAGEADAGRVRTEEIDRWFEMNEEGAWETIARHVLAAAEV